MIHVIINSFLLLSLIGYISTNPHVHKLNKERVEDAFQSSHYPNGQHNSEFDHEAVLGSRDKAKEFDNLSPSESKNALRILVANGMDVNKDGFVDKQELNAWLVKSFKSLAIEDGKERLEEEDLNKDGFVTWDEHLRDSFDIEDNLDDDNLLRD